MASFGPKTIAILQHAHDDACRWLSKRDGENVDPNLRLALARRIVRSAGRGERDPSKLKAYALAGIARP